MALGAGPGWPSISTSMADGLSVVPSSEIPPTKSSSSPAARSSTGGEAMNAGAAVAAGTRATVTSRAQRPALPRLTSCPFRWGRATAT